MVKGVFLVDYRKILLNGCNFQNNSDKREVERNYCCGIRGLRF